MRTTLRTSIGKQLFLIFFFLCIPTSTAFAATPWTGCFASTPGAEGVATIQCLVPLFRNVVIAILQLSAVALFIVFVSSGFTYLSSGGNPKQLEKARMSLTYAIIGVVVIILAWLIIKLIEQFTGVTTPLDIFTIPDASN